MNLKALTISPRTYNLNGIHKSEITDQNSYAAEFFFPCPLTQMANRERDLQQRSKYTIMMIFYYVYIIYARSNPQIGSYSNIFCASVCNEVLFSLQVEVVFSNLTY